MGNYDELPQEIMLGILFRVPAKSVGLCRCVSKPWRALLSQPDFIKTHLQHAKTNPIESLAITDVLRSTGCDVYLAPLNNAHHMLDEITLSLTRLSFRGFGPLSVDSIYGSCDGLLMAFSSENGILVMNPTTKEIRQVPRPPPPLVVYNNDGHQVFFRYGFGYDSVTDDYKIVIIYFCYGLENGRYVTYDALFDVYSLKIGSWKRLESSTYNYTRFCLGAGAFVGGCLHWLHTRPTDGKAAIVAFDLVDGKVRDVPFPSSILDILQGFYIDDIFQYKLGVLEGCLCMSYATECGGVVWVMKEYGVSKSWTKFVVNQPFGMFDCSLSDQEQVVMRFHDDNQILWNLKQRTSKKIVFNGFSGRSGDLGVEANFVESLVSPHSEL